MVGMLYRFIYAVCHTICHRQVIMRRHYLIGIGYILGTLQCLHNISQRTIGKLLIQEILPHFAQRTGQTLCFGPFITELQCLLMLLQCPII